VIREDRWQRRCKMAEAVALKRGSKELANHWRGLVEEWSRSGLTQAEFCRRRRLSVPSFRWWKARFRRADGSGRRTRTSAGRGVTRGVRSTVDGRVAFAELAVLPGTQGDGAESRSDFRLRAACYEVVLARGRVIRVGAEFDPDVVAELIAAVEAVPEVGSC